MTGKPPDKPARVNRSREWFLRMFGFATALLYLGMGTLVIVLLFFVGLTAGFNETRFWLAFVAAILYTCGTVVLAVWLGLRPSGRRGFLLAVLVAPSMLYFGYTFETEYRQPRDAASVFVANAVPEEAEQARRTLLAYDRAAGPQPHVITLLNALNRAEDDAERIRLICVLGELSYQYAPALDALRELERLAAGDPDRAALHEVVIHALLGINPYEDLRPGHPSHDRPPRPLTCR